MTGKGRLILIVLLVVGSIAGMLAWKFYEPMKKAQDVEDTSMAKDMLGEIDLRDDNFFGYFMIRSKQMRSMMIQNRWHLKITDDKADYPARMEALAKGEADMAVVTVDSYLLNAAKYDYPGTLTFVIDKSAGVDALVGWKKAGTSLNDFRGKKIRVCFTPDSPSHHFLKALKTGFDLPEVLPPKGSPLRIETDGSEEAMKFLLADKCDLAMGWEPDISRTLAKESGIVRLIGTEKMDGYIVDVLAVSREFLKKHPEAVKLFMANYFRALNYYTKEHPEELRIELMAETGQSAEVVEKMLKGIVWVNLTQNCLVWFGIGPASANPSTLLAETIESTVAVLIDNKDFDKNPLPDGDPFKIFYGDILAELFKKSAAGMASENAPAVVNSLETKFDAMSADRWATLKEIGTLKVEPIVFQSGTARLGLDGKTDLDLLAEKMKHFPTARLKVFGHTSIEGDPVANKELSLERAEACVKYFEVTYSMDPNRFLPIGMGGGKPLPQLPDEEDRGWLYRLPRVEMMLVVDEI
ncbi:MAG: OmpA/MotB domain protein [Parcubacteria group bacterium GW2011_GWA2_40_23]|nr:MAG: OmpA/MotB domain protein [Parcubacteria group bacterium GW2011_GWA2_40_23]